MFGRLCLKVAFVCKVCMLAIGYILPQQPLLIQHVTP